MVRENSGQLAEIVQTACAYEPAKALGELTLGREQLEKQARLSAGCLASYDDMTRGTCGDERPRAGLLNGDRTVESRPSAWGGPNIYALFMAEFTGHFAASKLAGYDRLESITNIINEAGITSGGHQGCAANGSFKDILAIVADTDNWKPAVKKQLGSNFNDSFADQLAANAQGALDSGTYDGWSESYLRIVLGDEAGVAIEELQPGPHTARVVERVWIDGHTIDQTMLAQKSGGETSFVQDEPYCQRIEFAVSGNDKSKIPILRHAREVLLQAVLLAVPNPELWQVSLK